MWLVAGLGNPGGDYADTRHNAGFNCIDELAELAGANYWKNECGALTAKGKLGGEEVVLAKPQSFMNASGGPVSQLLKKYDIVPDHLIVIHDELDIMPGSIRVKFGGGLAGHNGLKSINEKLGTKDWYRVRVGIGRPDGRRPVIDWVLSQPKGEAQDDFRLSVHKAACATECLLERGLEQTQQEFN